MDLKKQGSRFVWRRLRAALRLFAKPARTESAEGDAPLRAELLSAEQMEERGRALADEHETRSGRSTESLLLHRLADNEAVIRETCGILAEALKQQRRVTPAGEWLLDNLYLIDEQVRMSRRHLPKRYSWELPVLERGVSAGLPRVYDIALNAISHGDGRFDEDSLSRFVRAYQDVTPLTLGELWAVPIMLRLALIENLRRVAFRVRSDRQHRNLADRWADAMVDIAQRDPKSLILVVADMARARPPMTSSFVAEIARRLQGQGASLTLPMTWIDQRLGEAGVTVDQLVQTAQHEQAADQVSIANCIGSLRLLDALDWQDFVEDASHVERVLRTDPAGIYQRMDFSTRDTYRHVVEQLARDAHIAETEVAQLAVSLAAGHVVPAAGEPMMHVGYFLVAGGFATLRERCGVPARSLLPWTFRPGSASFASYALPIVALGVLLVAPALMHLWELPAPTWVRLVSAFCAIVAVSQLAVALVNRAASLVATPRALPRMDFRNGIPVEARTLVVVPTLLGSASDAVDLVEDLEIRFLANRDTHLQFALLTDFPDWHEAARETDGPVLDAAVAAIEALNRRYGADRFLLLHRPRVWNESERSWIGFERKRGKLSDLNALLRGGARERFARLVGDIDSLEGIRYVITLDTDTQLPRDTARQLVATMEHPLNRPRYGDSGRLVVGGYGILQPRIGNTLPPEGVSPYAALFGGDAGIDPYTRAVSDTYQDLFGEGSFIGKGIYDVDAFERVLGDRFPENRILSHDLLEGCYARSGLTTDIEFYERYPQSYLVDMKRRHRWVRGDWQIAQWLFAKVPIGGGRRERNPLSALSHWKIFDNLRRSLVTIALFGLLILGWFALPSPAFWTALVLEILLLPPLVDIALTAARRSPESTMAQHLGLIARDAWRRLVQILFAAASMPYEAWLTIDAIARTFWRVPVSRRRLLQWVASSSVERGDRHRLVAALRSMWIAPVSAILIGAALFQLGTNLWYAAPWLGLWALAPVLAWRLSAIPADASQTLQPAQLAFIRNAARRTWGFFERFINDEDNWLPPDNYQEQPIAKIAHRTSPTNIGLSLLANLAAYDFGYLSQSALLERTSRTLQTLQNLARHRGHFYNWYDTASLQPLHPLYVSTVDSGNLIAHLLTLRQGLLECIAAPLPGAAVFNGLADTLSVLRDLAPAVDAAHWQPLVDTLAAASASKVVSPQGMHAALSRLSQLATAVNQELTIADDPAALEWCGHLRRQCDAALADLVELVPSAARSDVDAKESAPLAMPSLADIARGEGGTPSAGAIAAASARIGKIEELAALCADFAHVDFEFLYDRLRSLFTIGYNVSEGRRDSGYYDLLASEARLGVFVAIAQSRVPQDSWFSLGRLLTSSEGAQVLLSWSGSMFEYLMPQLVMPTFPGTLIDQTCRAAVSRQIAYGRQKNVPWGISESGYNVTDAAQNYQYRAFGVPGLGLQRGLAQELVIAPYASALALPVAPQAVESNLRTMAANGWLTPHGFYEAIDYTPSRLPHGETHAVVRSLMAHHQGMSLLAFAQVVLDRPMQRRFEADPELQATLLLLQERVPRTSIRWASDPAMVDVRTVAEAPQTPLRVFTRADLPRPAVQLLSNGRYQVMVTNAGSGYSRWRNLAVTRWREDSTRDCWGMYCYLRDCDSGKLWSTSPQPTLTTVDFSETIFTEPSVEFRRRLDDIEAYTQIVVSPEDDIELRRTRITNRSRVERTIEITSYAEIVLSPAIADALHPAFGNLFVQTEIVPSRDAILATRRPRAEEEMQPWMLHLLAVHGSDSLHTSFESDRMRFIGRGNDLGSPAALRADGALSGSHGSVLDPIVAVRHRVRLQPEQTVVFDMVTGAADTREECMVLIDKYRDRHLADRAIELAWTHNRVALGQINISEADAQTYGRLAGCIIFADPARRTAATVVASNRHGQPGLWAHAISGDLPIVLLQMSSPENIDLARQVIHAHAYCRMKGLLFDLVIWNEERGGYRQALHDQLMGMIATSMDATVLERPGGIFVRAVEQINHEDRVLMQSVARVVLSDRAGMLAEQLRTPKSALSESPIPKLAPTRARDSTDTRQFPLPPRMLINGIGGFTQDGREYAMNIDAAQRTPLPWVNVIANPHFGCVVSESGSSYTWMENAHEYRLSPWHNDPVSDPSGEAFYIRDDETGHYWSPTPLPAAGTGRYVVRHGFGYSVFEHLEGGVSSHLRIHVDGEAPVKFFMVRLRNDSGRARKLSLTGYIEWVLGDLAPKTAMHVVTELDATGALLARNAYSIEFADLVAFFDVDNAHRTISGDRTEFIGRNCSLRNPAALGRQSLSGRIGPLMDPCGAIQIPVELADGESRDFIFRLGVGRDREDASALVQRFRRNGSARASFEAMQARWTRLLGAVAIDTPDTALNALANGWLLYQVIGCRLWARSGFYQSGGAFGFRDQLQDTMALVHTEPALLRAQILLCATRQFREGDVQHWWHPPAGRGVRTHCSDDYLWLPLAAARYIRATGDTAVLDERTSFLEGRVVSAGEESYYDLPLRSHESADLYQHCVRAIERGFGLGAHGLPLIGSGDWNDGMNNVGRHGKGESIWLGFFLYHVLTEFQPLARARGDDAFAERCRKHAELLRANLETHGWDGDWYRRAYFDDGTPLGSARNVECRIDSIAQSWAVLSGAGDAEHAERALDALDHHLVDDESRLIRLLQPPFDKSDPDPGYIRGYVPGVRENGGQYTHAAVWAIMAFAQAGRGERAWELFDMVNPLRHAARSAEVDVYKVEPYVAAADVLAVAPHTGRGGWTWYTGSAGWMYRLIIESLLGVTREGARLRIEPCLPPQWPGLSVVYRFGEATYEIAIARDAGAMSSRLVLDGVSQADMTIALDAGAATHRVEVYVVPFSRLREKVSRSDG
jgi:cyclic beta-1,2-glucan synthetase